MSEGIIFFIVIIIIFVLFFIFIIVLNLLFKDKKVSTQIRKLDVIQMINNGKIVEVQDLNDFLKNQNVSKEDLTKVCNYFVANHKLPHKKTTDQIPASARMHIRFISLLSSHPNADAKIISFFNNTLKRVNPGYEKEIDQFESNGIKHRRS